jgi:DNA-binding response OmpR family regulator
MHFNKNKYYKILALDDDPVSREYIKITLGDIYTIEYAADIAETRNILNKFRPDIFLLDVNLPDGNGIDLCRELKSNAAYRDCFFIVLTARTDEKTLEEAYSNGADEYFRKPFSQFELKSKIKIINRIMDVRENLKVAYQTQLDYNVQLYKLGDYVRKALMSTDSETVLLNAEKLSSMIDTTYLEILKVKKGVPLSIIQKHTSKKYPHVTFREIQNKSSFTSLTEKEINFFIFKKGDREIYICLFSLKFKNTVYGYILIERNEPFVTNDREIISLYMDYINLINDRLAIQHEMREINNSFKKEITIIRKLEVSQLPDFRVIEGYDTAFSFMPAQDLSGDFFDGFFLDDETYQIILCDVSGHGVSSSYVGNQIRTLLREKSSPGKKPSEIAAEVNNSLAETFADHYFYCTAQIVQIFLSTNHIIFVSAGHPEALIYRDKTKNISMLKGQSPMIGMFKDETYKDEMISLDQGDFLFLYTDGIIEELDPAYNEMLGTARLMESFTGIDNMSSGEIIHNTLGRFYEFNGYRPQKDDITLICIKKT